MGFTHHPGPLPFATIRDSKWANRLTVGENIEIHGEHGCTMPPTAALVTNVVPYLREPPAHLAGVYKGRELCVVWLKHTDDVWQKVGESWVRSDRVTFRGVPIIWSFEDWRLQRIAPADEVAHSMEKL